MPIRPDLRPLYWTPAWRAVRRRVLARAGGTFLDGRCYNRLILCRSWTPKTYRWRYRDIDPNPRPLPSGLLNSESN